MVASNLLFGQTIAAFRYQNLRNVRKRFQMIYDGILAELRLAAEAYRAANDGKMLNLEDCWRRFFHERMDDTADRARDFVQEGIMQMRDWWHPDQFVDPVERGEALQVMQRLNTLMFDIELITMEPLEG
jgi:hypothetical protein